MKNKLSTLFHDKQIKKIFILNICFFSVFLIVGIWKWSALSPQLPLFYSQPRGSEQLGTPLHLLYLPTFSGLFAMINFYLASIFYTKERLAAIILTVITTIVSLLFLITFVKIVLLVT